MVSVASSSVSSHRNPTEGARSPNAPPPKTGPSAAATESSVHIPSGVPAARNTERTRGGSITAATPPWTTNTRLVCGGGRAEGDLAAGNFVAPTLFADVSNDMSIARDTGYGLADTVWTSDVHRAMRMTKAIKAGTVGVNDYQLEPNSPFGGFPSPAWAARAAPRSRPTPSSRPSCCPSPTR
jgi:hypothetical protein